MQDPAQVKEIPSRQDSRAGRVGPERHGPVRWPNAAAGRERRPRSALPMRSAQSVIPVVTTKIATIAISRTIPIAIVATLSRVCLTLTSSTGPSL